MGRSITWLSLLGVESSKLRGTKLGVMRNDRSISKRGQRGGKNDREAGRRGGGAALLQVMLESLWGRHDASTGGFQNKGRPGTARAAYTHQCGDPPGAKRPSEVLATQIPCVSPNHSPRRFREEQCNNQWS